MFLLLTLNIFHTFEQLNVRWVVPGTHQKVTYSNLKLLPHVHVPCKWISFATETRVWQFYQFCKVQVLQLCADFNFSASSGKLN